MYRGSRQIHKWVGACLAIFLVVIAFTGFFLAIKKKVAWMQPPPAEAQTFNDPSEIISIKEAIDAAFALGLPELQKVEDLDRVDYRPGDNIFKVISNEGYREVQVDGKTGKVLTSSFRNDQLFEDIHDMSFFSGLMKDWLLPLVAAGLLTLGLSGIVIFTTPYLRRWQFKKGGGVVKKK